MCGTKSYMVVLHGAECCCVVLVFSGVVELWR